MKDVDLMSAREMRREIKELREGKCRFKCRGQREAFYAGFRCGQIDAAEGGMVICPEYQKEVENEAYREWRATESDD
jgi:hypothetical protein